MRVMAIIRTAICGLIVRKDEHRGGGAPVESPHRRQTDPQRRPDARAAAANGTTGLEKLLYAFWQPRETAAMLQDLGPALKRLAGVRSVQLNLPDARFCGAGQTPIRRLQPGLEGTVGIWIDSASLRAPAEALIGRFTGGMHGYSVVESEPLPNTRFPVGDGRRLPALSQVCFLGKPDRMDHGEWLQVWLDGHTAVAIATQSTFQYVQNAVLRPLTAGAPALHGIIEECFPEEAFDDDAVFYDAVGDADRLRANVARMNASCARFIDPARIDRIFTAQHVV